MRRSTDAGGHDLVLLWLAAGSLAAASCGGCGGSGTDGGEDGGEDGAGDAAGCPEVVPRAEPNPFDGAAASFIVDSLRVGDPATGEGFDLDCQSTSRHPWLPDDGPGGVDNQFGLFVRSLEEAGVPIDVSGDIQRSVEEGGNLILFRLLDVDDWHEDPGTVYLGVYGGADEDDDPTNNASGSGRLLVREGSLADPDDLLTPRSWFIDGVLADVAADDRLEVGDFAASGADVVLELQASGELAPLPIHAARVVWDFERLPSGDPPLDGAIAGGLLGGYVELGDAVRFVVLAYGDWLAAAGIEAETLRDIVAGQADLDLIPPGFVNVPCTEATAVLDCGPGQSCEADAERGRARFCFETQDNLDAISVGFLFTAVSCDIVGIQHGTP